MLQDQIVSRAIIALEAQCDGSEFLLDSRVEIIVPFVGQAHSRPLLAQWRRGRIAGVTRMSGEPV